MSAGHRGRMIVLSGALNAGYVNRSRGRHHIGVVLVPVHMATALLRKKTLLLLDRGAIKIDFNLNTAS